MKTFVPKPIGLQADMLKSLIPELEVNSSCVERCATLVHPEWKRRGMDGLFVIPTHYALARISRGRNPNRPKEEAAWPKGNLAMELMEKLLHTIPKFHDGLGTGPEELAFRPELYMVDPRTVAGYDRLDLATDGTGCGDIYVLPVSLRGRSGSGFAHFERLALKEGEFGLDGSALCAIALTHSAFFEEKGAETITSSGCGIRHYASHEWGVLDFMRNDDGPHIAWNEMHDGGTSPFGLVDINA